MEADAGGPDLRGQVGLVTGAGRGIGREIALELAACGMAVALCARTVDQLDEVAAQIEEAGGQALVAPGDVADRIAVESVIGRVESGLGPLGLLVNNVGAGPVREFLGTDPDDWWRTVEVNLRGAALCTYFALKRMAPRGRGRIVTIVSDHAGRPAPATSAVAAARAGLVRLTDSLAAEALEHGVRLFALSPGPTDGDPAGEGSGAGAAAVRAPLGGAAAVVAQIATGRCDRLSGRWLDAGQDFDDLVARAEEVERQDAQQLRMRRLDRPSGDGPSGAWRPPKAVPAEKQAG